MSNTSSLPTPGITTETTQYTTNILIIFSAIIEHTNRVIFLEDDDTACIRDGGLTLHRRKKDKSDKNQQNDTERYNIEIYFKVQC